MKVCLKIPELEDLISVTWDLLRREAEVSPRARHDEGSQIRCSTLSRTISGIRSYQFYCNLSIRRYVLVFFRCPTVSHRDSLHLRGRPVYVYVLFFFSRNEKEVVFFFS